METLASLKAGQKTLIAGIDGRPDDRLRLMEQGFIRGRGVAVVRGGNPLICDIDGARLSMSRELAEIILIRDQESKTEPR